MDYDPNVTLGKTGGNRCQNFNRYNYEYGHMH